MPEYKIYFKDGQWIAVERHPDDGSFLARMDFCGYGDSPENALKNIESSHESFGKAILDF